LGGIREPLGPTPLPGLPAPAEGSGHGSAGGSQLRGAGGSLHGSASFSLFRAPSPRGGAAPGPAGLAPERADSAPGWSLVPSSSEVRAARWSAQVRVRVGRLFCCDGALRALADGCPDWGRA